MPIHRPMRSRLWLLLHSCLVYAYGRLAISSVYLVGVHDGELCSFQSAATMLAVVDGWVVASAPSLHQAVQQGPG